MADLAIPFILLLGGVLFILLELFLPSGGVLGLLAAGMIGAAIWQSFQSDPQTGLLFVLAAIVLVPAALILGLSWMPKTPLAKRMVLKNPPPADASVTGKPGVASQDLEALVGARGRTVSPLRPAGIALIDGHRYSVVCRGFIERDTDIIVSRIEGNNIVVKPAPSPSA